MNSGVAPASKAYPTQHSFAHTFGGKDSCTINLMSRATQAGNRPFFHPGDVVTGSIDLDIKKKLAIKAMDVTVGLVLLCYLDMAAEASSSLASRSLRILHTVPWVHSNDCICWYARTPSASCLHDCIH